MIGLVAKNAMMVVDFTNKLRDEGVYVKDVLIEAVRIRFRPHPDDDAGDGDLNVADCAGGRFGGCHQKRPGLGTELSSSIFLTLIVVPIIYCGFDRFLAKFGFDKKTKNELEDTTLEELEHEAAMLQEQKMAPEH